MTRMVYLNKHCEGLADGDKEVWKEFRVFVEQDCVIVYNCTGLFVYCKSVNILLRAKVKILLYQ